MDFINILKGVISEQTDVLLTEGHSWSSTKIGSPLKSPGRCNNYHEFRQRYNSGNGGYHDACDIPVTVGTAIFAPHDGKVSEVSGVRGACGNGIIIKGKDGNGNKLHSGFCHLRSREVTQGNEVKKGDIIGYTGGKVNEPGAGTSTGPHLHWTFKVNGTPKNPYTY